MHFHRKEKIPIVQAKNHSACGVPFPLPQTPTLLPLWACVGFGPSGWLLFLLLGPEPCTPLQPRQSHLSILNIRIPAELFPLGTAQGEEARSQSGAEMHRARRKDPFPTASTFSSALRAGVPFAESFLGTRLTKGDLYAHSPHSKTSGLERALTRNPHHTP